MWERCSGCRRCVVGEVRSVVGVEEVRSVVAVGEMSWTLWGIRSVRGVGFSVNDLLIGFSLVFVLLVVIQMM